MSRFWLYKVADGGLLLDLQSDFLESYNTRVVAPVVPLAQFDQPASGLNPLIRHQGQDFVLLTHFVSAVPASTLRQPLADFSQQATEFTRALDLLFQGY